MKLNIREPFSRVRVNCASGERYQPSLVLKKTKDGDSFIKTGEVDLYSMIQSHADSVSMDVIMAKFAAGDTSVLNKHVGTYGDISTIPTNIHEMYNDIQRAEGVFSLLPASVKEEYNNDPGLFFSDSNVVAKYFAPSAETTVSASSVEAAKDVIGQPTNPVIMKEGEE